MDPELTDIPIEDIFSRFYKELLQAAAVLAKPDRTVLEENRALELMRVSADEAMLRANTRDKSIMMPFFQQAISENRDLKPQLKEIALKFYELML